MSSSREMSNDMGLILRAIRYGFASMHPDRLGQDLMRMYGDIVADDWGILKYVKRKSPAGVRLKHSTATRALQAMPDASTPPTKRKHSETTTNYTEGLKSEESFGLLDNDVRWVHQLLDTTLAGWLWDKFPNQDKREPASRIRGPLLYSNWFVHVRVGTEHSSNRKNLDAFLNAIDRLFPPDWVLGDVSAQYRLYQETVLDPIRERISAFQASRSMLYDDRLRQAIRSHLRETWEYLPPLQKSKVWPALGKPGQRVFNTCPNPSHRRKLMK